MSEKITIEWDELHTQQVDEALQQLERVRKAGEQYRSAPAPEPLLRSLRRKVWYNTIVYLGLFGFMGGVLGWCGGQVLNLQPSMRQQARELADAQREVAAALTRGELTAAEALTAQTAIARAGADNPYFNATPQTSPAEGANAERQVSPRERTRDFIADMLFYGVCGLLISMCLSAAEAIVDRNYTLAVINGSVGALCGLLGGLVVSLFLERLNEAMLGSSTVAQPLWRVMLARSLSWAVLGLFLSLAPALITRNIRRLTIGVAGGIAGGLLGGLLFDPLVRATGSVQISRLVGMVGIGLLTGIGTGMFEQAAKVGWLKVVAGLIAGKQFVIYRNPTYLGSSPHCQIYLFKDGRIGARHAAIHSVAGGFELEDLPLGSRTLVNGRPITRTRLRHGDRIQIGAFVLLFQVREKDRG